MLFGLCQQEPPQLAEWFPWFQHQVYSSSPLVPYFINPKITPLFLISETLHLIFDSRSQFNGFVFFFLMVHKIVWLQSVVSLESVVQWTRVFPVSHWWERSLRFSYRNRITDPTPFLVAVFRGRWLRSLRASLRHWEFVPWTQLNF